MLGSRSKLLNGKGCILSIDVTLFASKLENLLQGPVDSLQWSRVPQPTAGDPDNSDVLSGEFEVRYLGESSDL